MKQSYLRTSQEVYSDNVILSRVKSFAWPDEGIGPGRKLDKITESCLTVHLHVNAHRFNETSADKDNSSFHSIVVNELSVRLVRDN
jgi:hypothetical protein